MTTPSPAEVTEYLTRHEPLEREISKLAWRTVCELEAGDVERAKKSAAACVKVQQQALELTRQYYPTESPN